MALISSLILPMLICGGATNVSADENEGRSYNQEFTIIDETIDLEYYENSPYFEVKTDGDNFEISLTDAALKQYASDNNLPAPETGKLRAQGQTKISGNIASGNFKIFIKKDHLNWLANRGSAGIGALFGGLPGFVVGSLVALIVPANYQHGRVFVYQGRNYQYWYYQ